MDWMEGMDTERISVELILKTELKLKQWFSEECQSHLRCCCTTLVPPYLLIRNCFMCHGSEEKNDQGKGSGSGTGKKTCPA